MMNINELKGILVKLSHENIDENIDKLAEDVFSVVYRVDIFECGDINIINRHIDIEYEYGESYEIHEGDILYDNIFSLCNLNVIGKEQDADIILYQKN